MKNQKYIIHDTSKLYTIIILVSINKYYWNTALPIYLHIMTAFFLILQKGWVVDTETYGPQSLKYLCTV